MTRQYFGTKEICFEWWLRETRRAKQRNLLLPCRPCVALNPAIAKGTALAALRGYRGPVVPPSGREGKTGCAAGSSSEYPFILRTLLKCQHPSTGTSPCFTLLKLFINKTQLFSILEKWILVFIPCIPHLENKYNKIDPAHLECYQTFTGVCTFHFLSLYFPKPSFEINKSTMPVFVCSFVWGTLRDSPKSGFQC